MQIDMTAPSATPATLSQSQTAAVAVALGVVAYAIIDANSSPAPDIVAMSGIDFDTQYLPDSLTLPLLWLGLVAAVVTGRGAGPFPMAPAEAIVGAVVGYLSLWSVYWLFRLITGREGMGRGDFKLLAALGAWLGWSTVPLIVLLSALVGALLGGALILFRGRDHQLPMPYGPFLAAAGFVAMLWGPALIAWYRGLSGL